MFGIYIHVPFCRTLCPYCDFVREPLDSAVPEAFVEAVCREIRSCVGPPSATSVFFGGGTPSLLAPGFLDRLLETLRKRFRLVEPEITIEANPDDVTGELLDAWRDVGINRVSLGVQSFDDATLRYLGRRHDANAARRACESVAARFENWAMDLIFGAPPVESWAHSLRECLSLGPKHVSTYGLTYESGTPFAARQNEAVDEETYLKLFWLPSEYLRGLDRYEISNFARPGYECRHNLLYWRNLEYAGFGPGAYSFLGRVRARNVVSVEEYVAAPGNKSEALTLTEREIRVETLIQHFRLKAGLNKGGYLERFRGPVEADFGPQLRTLVRAELLEEDDSSFRPTRKGFEVNNEIGLALVEPASTNGAGS
jgi:oxygen-independent coproporphyrinogen-3 oxidase